MLVRTVISLDKSDKKWLDKKASSEHIAMTEMVRRAIKHYRQCEDIEPKIPSSKILKETRGLWREGDALQYQQKIREEWGGDK